MRPLIVLVVVITLAGCGGSTQKTVREAGVVTNGGAMVGIGGGRSLYLKCVGSGSPTVILEAGFGGTTNDWSAVQPALGRTTRTCAYDRAGLGNSLPISGVHDAGGEIADLQALLEHAKLAPPYVLVGHSYGGLLARLYANAHPDRAAAVVLLEAMGRNQDRQLLKIWRAAPARVRHALPKPTADPVVDGVDIAAGEALDAKVRALDTPLVVVSRGRADVDELPPVVRLAAGRAWMRMQDELAAMSSDRVHVVATRSNHFVQGYAEGQPRVVLQAILAATAAARAHAKLPSCPELFHGPGVRCRN